MYGGRRPPRNEERSLFEATVAAEGVTTLAGEGTGLSLRDLGLAGAGANSFVSMMAVIHPGDPQNVDSRDITTFNNVTGEVTVASAFKGGQVAAGVPYKIVTFRFVPAEVAALTALVNALMVDVGDPTGETLPSLATKWGDIARSLDLILGARWDGAGDLGTDILAIINALAALVGVTGIFHEQADAGINATVVAAEQFVVTLNAANTRYILRDLRIKSADPGAAETITVKLYTLINSVEVNVDSFIITNANFTTHFSLMDMFGIPHVAGDSIRVSLTGTAAGGVAVTGQYSHGKTNV